METRVREGEEKKRILLSFKEAKHINTDASYNQYLNSFPDGRHREKALESMAVLRGTLMELYAAHAVWDWGFKPDGSTGRSTSAVNWQEHCDLVVAEILNLTHDLSRWLTLPNGARARHRTTSFGRSEAEQIQALSLRLYRIISRRFATLAKLCEVLKREGLPPNEATRVRQWERFVLQQVEVLRAVKLYRTPQALRSFGRLFSVLVPPVYAPFYAQVAVDINSLGLAIVFAVLTSLALTALFETVYQMEE